MTTGASEAEPFDDRKRSLQRAAFGEPPATEMEHDRIARQLAHSGSVLVGNVQAKRPNAPARTGKGDEIEQLHDFVADDSAGIAIAEVRIGLRNHDLD